MLSADDNVDVSVGTEIHSSLCAGLLDDRKKEDISSKLTWWLCPAGIGCTGEKCPTFISHWLGRVVGCGCQFHLCLIVQTDIGN